MVGLRAGLAPTADWLGIRPVAEVGLGSLRLAQRRRLQHRVELVLRRPALRTVIVVGKQSALPAGLLAPIGQGRRADDLLGGNNRHRLAIRFSGMFSLLRISRAWIRLGIACLALSLPEEFLQRATISDGRCILKGERPSGLTGLGRCGWWEGRERAAVCFVSENRWGSLARWWKTEWTSSLGHSAPLPFLSGSLIECGCGDPCGGKSWGSLKKRLPARTPGALEIPGEPAGQPSLPSPSTAQTSDRVRKR